MHATLIITKKHNRNRTRNNMHATTTPLHTHPVMQCVNKAPLIKVPRFVRNRDYGDDIDSENCFVQVFEDPSEKIVDFTPVTLWQIGEDNVIEYTLPFGYEEAENDWIGVYKVRRLNGKWISRSILI